MTSLICGNLKTSTNELIYKTETDSPTENKVMITKGEGEIYINQDLLHSTGNYINIL